MKLRRMRTLLALVLVLTLLLTACGSAPDSSESSREDSSISSKPEPTSVPESSASEPEPTEPPFDPYAPIANPLYIPTDITLDETIPARLKEQTDLYPECVGWLQIPGTLIDYPIAQHEDNDFYLSHDLQGNSDSSGGEIYAHFNNDLSDPAFLPMNTVIFGHNMWIRNNRVFTTLERFYDLEYAKEHRYITLTVGDTTTCWLIYAIFDTEMPQGDAQYDFYYWNTYGQTLSEWENVQGQIRGRSLYDYDIDVQYEDNLLMLSTCSYHYTTWLGFLRDDIRLVLVARLVREGEELADAPLPSLNPDRIVPANT